MARVLPATLAWVRALGLLLAQRIKAHLDATLLSHQELELELELVWLQELGLGMV